MNKAVFLDRDGTINVDKGYLHRIADFEFIPGAREALARLYRAGWRVVIVTNQSGVARGYYTEDDVLALHEWLRETLAEDGVYISGIYHCPHHPHGTIARYSRECDCRKPGLGLFYRAAAELGLDIDASAAMGDRARDLQICGVSKCAGYLLGNTETEADLPSGVKRANDLLAAAKDILERYK
jgi:D-glycero-D-manno-heptose 1,7-bisphosphate phosphatase